MSELNIDVEGFIATDPVQGTTQNGKPYLQVLVAHNERRKNPQSGQWENSKDKDGNDIVSWIRATFWDDEATAFASQLSKGTLVTLRGRGRVSAYIDQQSGAPRGQLEVLWPKCAVVLRRPSQSTQASFGGAAPAPAPSGQGQAAWGAPAASQSFSGGFDDASPF